MTNKLVLSTDDSLLANTNVHVPIVDWIDGEVTRVVDGFFTEGMFNSTFAELGVSMSRLARHTALRMMSERRSEECKHRAELDRRLEELTATQKERTAATAALDNIASHVGGCFVAGADVDAVLRAVLDTLRSYKMARRTKLTFSEELSEGDIHTLTEQLRDLLDNGFGSTEDMQNILQLFTAADVERDVAERAVAKLAHTAVQSVEVVDSERTPADTKVNDILTLQIRNAMQAGYKNVDHKYDVISAFREMGIDQVESMALAELVDGARPPKKKDVPTRSTFDYNWLQDLWCTLMDAANSVNGTSFGDTAAQRFIKAALVQVEEAKQTWPEPAAKQMTFIDDVVKYQLAAGRTADSFNVRQLALHTGFQASEFSEKLDALCKAGLGTIRGTEMFTLYNVTTQLKYLSKHLQDGDLDFLFPNADVLELLDGDIDVMVVSIASMMSQGVDMQGAFKEVMRSQYSKMTDGKLKFHPDGKIKKPEGWQPPDLVPFLYGPLRDRILDQRSRMEASTAEVEQIEAQRQRELAALNAGNKNQ
jgi:predicted HAD superfamily Cof-like phosphohydrolase